MAAWSLKSRKPGSVCTTIYCKIIRFRLGSIFVEFMGTSQPLTKFCPHKHIELQQSTKIYPTNFNASTVVCFATTGWELTSNNFCKQMAIIFFSIQKLSLVCGNTCKYPPFNLADIYCRTNFLIGNWNTQLRTLQGFDDKHHHRPWCLTASSFGEICKLVSQGNITKLSTSAVF